MLTGVREANALTARWVAALDDGSTVVSGATVWPLLAALCAGADGPAREELRAAVGSGLSDPMAAARGLLAALGDATAVRAALGLWVRDGLPLLRPWRDGLPPAAVGTLAGDVARALDAWVSEQTDGQLDRMPVEVGDDTMLLLAAALSVRTRWVAPFEDQPLRCPGAWERHGEVAGLARVERGMDTLRVADGSCGPVTLLTVEGRDDVDVHLALSDPGRGASDVLPAAIATVQGDCPVRTGDAVAAGHPAPGVTVTDVVSFDPTPFLRSTTVRFTVRAEHDLLKQPQVFGLASVTDKSRGHLPGISSMPLAVGQARQDVVATFSAVGFEAAAITAIEVAAAGMPAQTAPMVSVTFNRPFGFVATHRPTGLVLLAGWVAEPEPWQEPPAGRYTW